MRFCGNCFSSSASIAYRCWMDNCVLLCTIIKCTVVDAVVAEKIVEKNGLVICCVFFFRGGAQFFFSLFLFSPPILHTIYSVSRPSCHSMTLYLQPINVFFLRRKRERRKKRVAFKEIVPEVLRIWTADSKKYKLKPVMLP